MKTSELTGAALDWAVAKCEHTIKRHKYGSPCFNPNTKRIYETEGLQQIGVNFAPSTDWAQGGPIIERERITIDSDLTIWCASCDSNQSAMCYGPTPLIAAMRCYVASKLGDTVDVPSNLM
jgi:hypothetical protein